nr:TonB-dependent receptor [Bacteroidota bacterium]
MIQKISILFLILFNALTIFSQNEVYEQTIRGRVLDKVTRSPLPGATIIIPGTDPLVGTTTDIDGYFRLDHIPVGRINLSVSYMGYESVVLNNILLTSGKELIMDIELEEKVITTEEVVITARFEKDKPLNKMATVSARSFSVEESSRFAGSLNDPSRMAANYAGVVIVDDSRNDIIIRGNSPLGLLWRLDGIDIPNPNHFGSLGTTGGPVSILNNNLLTNSDFFTGAFPAEYGNAISGVFDLQMRTGNNEKREYTGQIGFNGFEVGLEGPFSKKNKSSYLASYRYSTLRAFHALGIDFVAGSSVPDYQDLSFKLDFPTKKWGRFSVFGIGGKSKIRLYDSEKDEDEFSWGLAGTDTDYSSEMGAVGLSNTFFFDENSRLRTNLSLQGARSLASVDSIVTLDPLAKSDYYDSDFREIIYSFSSHLAHKFSSRNNIIGGVIIERYDVRYVDSVFDESIFKIRTNANGFLNLYQAYFQWQHKFSKELVLNSGLHWQQFSLNSSWSLEPRVGLSWELKPSHTLSFGYGLMSQTQPKMNYFTRTKLPDSTFVETNRGMGFSRSHQVVLGYDHHLSGPVRIKVETYYQYLFNIPVKESFPEFSLINEGDYFAITLEDSLLNRGAGHNYGLELTL